MKKSKFILINLIIIFLLTKHIGLAKVLIDQESTTEENFKNIPTEIILTEVNFKNSQQDYIRFKIQSGNNNSPVNLKGLQFYDDKIFKTIEDDYWTTPGNEITLTFNQNKSDSAKDHQLYTTHAGLTSTTEQIILSDQQHYFDFFCWQDQPISKQEKTEFSKIYQAPFWESKNIESCFDSNKIAKDQSLIRQSNHHNSADWEIKNDLGERADSIQQNAKTSNSSNKSSIKQNSNKKTKINQINLSSQSETLDSSPLEITEIFPAPTKPKTEWIEIHNRSEQTINLQNWYLDDQEGGSKPYKLENTTLKADQYILIDSKQSKINLNNTMDQVRLFNPQKQLADLSQYQSTSKNQSFAKIFTDNQSEWIWTDQTTPGEANPVLHSFSGHILEEPQFQEKYFFKISLASGEIMQINFTEKIIKAPLAKQLFQKNIIGTFIGELDKAAQDNLPVLQLQKYQLQTAPQNQQNSSPLLPVGATIISAGTGAYLLFRKYLSWKISISS